MPSDVDQIIDLLSKQDLTVLEEARLETLIARNESESGFSSGT